MTWIPLRVHSQYSILTATSSVKEIAKQAAAYGLPAVALTDSGNLYGAVDFYKACMAENVRPIIGCDMYVAPGSRHEKKKEYGVRPHHRLTLLAKNQQGYKNLCKLSSVGFLEGFYYNPRIDREILGEHAEGLICLSGGPAGRIAEAILEQGPEDAHALIDDFLALFGEDFYLELQRHPMTAEELELDGMHQESWLIQQYEEQVEKEKRLNEALVAIAKERGIPLVATNDSHYMDRSDWRAHEILLNVQSGEPCEIWEKDAYGNPKFLKPNPKRRTFPTHSFHFRSPQEMAELFHDIPEALQGSLNIAEKCQLEFDFKAKHYPVFVPPELEGKQLEEKERDQAVEQYLWKLCEEGIPKRYTPERLAKVQEVYPGKDPMQVVRDRLNYEMGIIAPKGMCDYLLIVWDFINWAKSQGIPVGPGRGSGAGSIVLYLIGVTDIEPLRFHLFFERFINPERLSYPDIDVDICMDRRGEVIKYTLEKYGKENVAQIITFGTMKAKMVIRDVGRVLSVPLSKVNAIAKLVPDDLDITLEKALEKDPDLKQLYDDDAETKRIIDLGRRLEGSIRSTGIHAAGLIIAGKPLVEYIPVCVAKDSDMPVTQFSMKPVEQVGMLKIDFLGLKTLTAIQTCAEEVKKHHGVTIDWRNLPLNDQTTFNLLNKGKTLGVFQLESGGMQDLARNLHLDRFEEIIAVGALYRPGPMDMIPSFIARKHGREPIEYDHPWIKEILDETYGIMVYQEQVMQIASTLAKYSLGEGDVLRRAMGKKDHQQMMEQREKFRAGATENGISEEVSMGIFDKMEKFASYGFNKSHAAAYGYLSYVTAYMKANYPSEWMAALMTCDRADLTKVAKFIREGQTMDIPILPPDVNEASDRFVATSAGIRFAMSGIKGVGEGVVEAIVTERSKNGPYEGLYDFFRRLDARKVGKKVAESLVDAGSFDFTGWTRDALRLSVEPMFDTAAKEQKEEQAGVMSLFSLLGDTPASQFEDPPEVKHPTSKEQILLKEKELLGFFLTGHPMDRYRDILGRLSCIPLRRVREMDDGTIFRSAVIVESVQARFSAKTQKKFAILMVSDGIDRFELPIWPDLYEQKGHLLNENQLLYAVLQLERQQDEVRLSCRWFDDLTRADESMIEACDQAYDKAKSMAARAAYMRKSGGERKQTKEPKNEAPVEKEQFKAMSVKLCTEKARISHILEIKKLFESHRGTTPVTLQFETEGQSFASVEIEQTWGVKVNEALKKKLVELPGVLDIETH